MFLYIRYKDFLLLLLNLFEVNITYKDFFIIVPVKHV